MNLTFERKDDRVSKCVSDGGKWLTFNFLEISVDIGHSGGRVKFCRVEKPDLVTYEGTN